MIERLHIRPEHPRAYADIAALHAAAFDNRVTEPLVVSLQRHRRGFDPELSLVAESGGRIVGHVLFFPSTMRLLGGTLRAVNLAPIGVLPTHQRQGIGSRLIEEGHRIAREKGYALSFLLGHPSYYPRFGYRTGAFGVAGARVRAKGLPAPSLGRRPVAADDVPALHALWEHDEAAVDFALDPGHDCLDWVSPNPAIAAHVYERTGKIVGYTRLHQDAPAQPRAFLAADAEAARLVAASIAARCGAEEVILPIHPSARSAAAFKTASAEPWRAAMAAPLDSPLVEKYFSLVDGNKRPVGRVTWPVAFDL